MLFSLLQMLGCVYRPDPVPLSSLEDIEQARGEKIVRIQAEVHPDVMGVARLESMPTVGGGTNTPIVHYDHVVALSDPGGSLDGGVAAWVTPPGFLKPDEVPTWTKALRTRLEAGALELRVGQFTDERPGTSGMRAVQDAVSKPGVTSREPALILMFDPKRDP